MEVLVFDIEGSFAHFRKFYTTSSALTYPFPPPTAVRGIIGAIVGYGKEEYLERTRGIKLGIQILNPIKYLHLSVNLINTKGNSGLFEPTLKQGRTQAIVQLLKFPKYRIFVGGSGEEFNRLKEHIKNRTFVYNLCLGTSEHLAEVSYFGLFAAEEKESLEADCVSVVPTKLLEELNITSVRIGKERVAYDMREDRSYPRYEDVLYSKDPKVPVSGKFKRLWMVDGKGIAFFQF